MARHPILGGMHVVRKNVVAACTTTFGDYQGEKIMRNSASLAAVLFAVSVGFSGPALADDDSCGSQTAVNNAITSAFGIRPVGLQEGLERYLGKKS